MNESRVRQNYWAILVATLASFVIAATRYSIFLQPWLRGISRTLADLKATGLPEWAPYIVALVMAGVMATAISCVTQLTGPQTGARGIRVGFLLWLGFVCTSLATEYAYEVRPLLFAINAGYWLLAMMVMGFIVGAWKKKSATAAPASTSDRARAIAR